jgi:hypothetical protein
MSVANTVWSVLFGTAPVVAATLFGLYRIFSVGLATMGQPNLPLVRCKLIGRYMIIGATFLLVAATVLAFAARFVPPDSSPRENPATRAVTLPSPQAAVSIDTDAHAVALDRDNSHGDIQFLTGAEFAESGMVAASCATLKWQGKFGALRRTRLDSHRLRRWTQARRLSVRGIEKSVDQFPDRILETQAPSVAQAMEKRIQAQSMFRTARGFLGNPVYSWDSGRRPAADGRAARLSARLELFTKRGT